MSLGEEAGTETLKTKMKKKEKKDEGGGKCWTNAARVGGGFFQSNTQTTRRWLVAMR